MTDIQRILLVEDEAGIQAVARVALEMVGGFVVHICASGMQALQEAEAFHPDLLILDVMMPGMDGPTTLQSLREKPALAAVPAIFMTAKVQPAEVDFYRTLGAVGVIAKPFDPMTLAAEVRKLVEGQA